MTDVTRIVVALLALCCAATLGGCLLVDRGRTPIAATADDEDVAEDLEDVEDESDVGGDDEEIVSEDVAPDAEPPVGAVAPGGRSCSGRFCVVGGIRSATNYREGSRFRLVAGGFESQPQACNESYCLWAGVFE
jgi:hypothetical protein